VSYVRHRVSNSSVFEIMAIPKRCRPGAIGDHDWGVIKGERDSGFLDVMHRSDGGTTRMCWNEAISPIGREIIAR